MRRRCARPAETDICHADQVRQDLIAAIPAGMAILIADMTVATVGDWCTMAAPSSGHLMGPTGAEIRRHSQQPVGQVRVTYRD
jgi:hypothetical protein